MSEDEPKNNQPPFAEIRLGKIKAAIWRSEGQYGPQYRVSLSKSFRTADGWRTVTSFQPGDLPFLRKAIDMAHDRVLLSQSEEREVEPAVNDGGRDDR